MAKVRVKHNLLIRAEICYGGLTVNNLSYVSKFQKIRRTMTLTKTTVMHILLWLSSTALVVKSNSKDLQQMDSKVFLSKLQLEPPNQIGKPHPSFANASKKLNVINIEIQIGQKSIQQQTSLEQEISHKQRKELTGFMIKSQTTQSQSKEIL